MVEGKVKSKFFHSIVKGRKKRLFLEKIKLEDGNWIEGDEDISKEAIVFFHKQFSKEDINTNFSLLNNIPRLVTDTDNDNLTVNPSMEELRDVVFSMSSNSSPGPDGFSGKFYHFCWDIIKDDLLLMISDFFAGNLIPRSITHTCLILIPKVDSPQAFTDLRPISLSNFSYKIISSLMNKRLSILMNNLISSNQTGFIKGRSINENIMLTQDMVHNISKPSSHENMILKLDMTKAYDRYHGNTFSGSLDSFDFMRNGLT